MGQKRDMPTKNQIFLHWQNILGLDPIKDKDMCWGCGFNIPLLERCHIEDRWINENDDVSNLIILCKTCHLMQETCCVNEEGRKKFIKLLLDGRPFMSIRIKELITKFESGIYDYTGIYNLNDKLQVIAQNEAKIIGQRTKAAFAAKKARGEKMGTPENLKHEHRLKGHATNKSKALANENNIKAAAYIQELIPYRLSLRLISNRLNKEQFKTSTGKDFTAMQVKRIIDKLKETNK